MAEHFKAKVDARWLFTPLMLALILIDIMDLVFAIDSIPAVFAITTDNFIVYTSNICAILGLRSLYFLLAQLIDRFVYLKIGLAFVLGFVGLENDQLPLRCRSHLVVSRNHPGNPRDHDHAFDTRDPATAENKLNCCIGIFDAV